MAAGLQTTKAQLAELAQLPPERMPDKVAELLKTLPSQLAELEHAPSHMADKDRLPRVQISHLSKSLYFTKSAGF